MRICPIGHQCINRHALTADLTHQVSQDSCGCHDFERAGLIGTCLRASDAAARAYRGDRCHSDEGDYRACQQCAPCDAKGVCCSMQVGWPPSS